MYSDFYIPIPFKLVMTGTTKLYILASVWMTLIFIQGHSCIKIKDFGVHFLKTFAVQVDEIQNAATTCCHVGLQLLKLTINLFCTSTI